MIYHLETQQSEHGDMRGRLKPHRECWQRTYVLTEKVQYPMGLRRSKLVCVLHARLTILSHFFVRLYRGACQKHNTCRPLGTSNDWERD